MPGQSKKSRRASTRRRKRQPQGRLAVVFGDQLDRRASLLRSLNRSEDTVLMMEVAAESTHAASHVQRTVLFLSATRHFARELEKSRFRVRYVRLEDPANTHSFTGEVARAVEELNPSELLCTHPGEWRVLKEVESCSEEMGLPLSILPDEHFLTTTEEFAAWAEGRRSLIMEHFYRNQRRATGYLMTGDGERAEPEGGRWNFDKDNRLPFGAKGPDPPPPAPVRFKPDAITCEVIRTVREHLPDLPGRLEKETDFGWPVTRRQALASLRDFVKHRLAQFGPYEDAMWTDTPFVYHAVISPALNLKLLNPRECCEAALKAYRTGSVPIQSAEAFIRQLIGWREFIRGVYWLEGPKYGTRNSLKQQGKLPEFYWTGETDMSCLRACINQVLDTAYGHHIQRLMVTGNSALISGVHPKTISDWYLGMYADGVDWVTLPNTLGMVMHADARPRYGTGNTGVVGTKPYAASGRYIQRMSNYCRSCPYDPAARSGPRACPFTVFYWDFLIRNQGLFSKNPRMNMILKNVDRMQAEDRKQIRSEARKLRKQLGIASRS